MSLADSFCGAIFPPHCKQIGRSSRAGFSQRVHDLHPLNQRGCKGYTIQILFLIVKCKLIKNNKSFSSNIKGLKGMQFTKYQISLHSGANARAERMTLFD